MEEFEVKFLNIDQKKIEQKLKAIGAKKEFEILYRVKVFDFPDFRMNAEAAWVRMRDEGDKIILTYKKRLGVPVKNGKIDKAGATNDEGMKEVSVAVDDFDKTTEFLHSIGLVDKFYEEKRRIRYVFNGIEFDIDQMPALEPYLEIESSSMEKVEEGIGLLGLNPEDKKIFSAFQIYKLKGIDMLDYESLTFKEGLIKRKIKIPK